MLVVEVNTGLGAGAGRVVEETKALMSLTRFNVHTSFSLAAPFLRSNVERSTRD